MQNLRDDDNNDIPATVAETGTQDTRQEQDRTTVPDDYFKDLDFGTADIDLSLPFAVSYSAEIQPTLLHIQAHKTETDAYNVPVHPPTNSVGQTIATEPHDPHKSSSTSTTQSPPRPRNRLIKNVNRRLCRPREGEKSATETPAAAPSNGLTLPADHHVTFTEDAVPRPMNRPRATSYSKEWRQIVTQNECLARKEIEARRTRGSDADSLNSPFTPTVVDQEEKLDESIKSYAPSHMLHEPKNGTVLDLSSPERNKHSASWLKKMFSKTKESSNENEVVEGVKRFDRRSVSDSWSQQASRIDDLSLQNSLSVNAGQNTMKCSTKSKPSHGSMQSYRLLVKSRSQEKPVSSSGEISSRMSPQCSLTAPNFSRRMNQGGLEDATLHPHTHNGTHTGFVSKEALEHDRIRFANAIRSRAERNPGPKNLDPKLKIRGGSGSSGVMAVGMLRRSWLMNSGHGGRVWLKWSRDTLWRTSSSSPTDGNPRHAGHAMLGSQTTHPCNFILTSTTAWKPPISSSSSIPKASRAISPDQLLRVRPRPSLDSKAENRLGPSGRSDTVELHNQDCRPWQVPQWSMVAEFERLHHQVYQGLSDGTSIKDQVGYQV